MLELGNKLCGGACRGVEGEFEEGFLGRLRGVKLVGVRRKIRVWYGRMGKGREGEGRFE